MIFEVVLSIAALLCLAFVAFGCLDCLFKKKKFQAFGIRDTTRAQHNAAFSVDIFDADNISDQVVIEPLPDILLKVSTVPIVRPQITCLERGKQEAALSHLSVQRSFPRDHLIYLNEIGSGWFGKVIESEAVQIVAGYYTSHVVVKMLRDDASKVEQKQFMEEVALFRCLEHPNLMHFFGQCVETTPYLVILEFAAHGNLKSYLVKHRQDVDALTVANRLVNFALNAASGLACLHRHDYVHNDLAARNCLIMPDYTLKIGDYGIADRQFKDEYYNTGTELLPIRWMAPEALIQTDGVWTSRNLSKISDMWSFGILLWEMCSLGERPYDSLTDELVLQNVVLNRLVLPSDVSTKLPFRVKMWSLMIRCWEEPFQRIDIEHACGILEQLKAHLDAVTVNADFDQKWNHLEPQCGKVTSINMDVVQNLGGSFDTDFSSASSQSSALPFYDVIDAASETRKRDVVIDVDSSATNLDGSSALNTSDQPMNAAMPSNFRAFQQNGSSLIIENELKRFSTPVSSPITTTLSDHQMNIAGVSLSKGPSSTSQYLSPRSSPSSEYMTVSESQNVSDTQEETLQELSSTDEDFSLESERTSSHELLNESPHHSKNHVVNNNNIETKFLSFSQKEADNFSEYEHTSSTHGHVNFTGFETSDTVSTESTIKATYQLESDLNSQITAPADDFTSAVVNSTGDITSEVVDSFSYLISRTNNNNTHIELTPAIWPDKPDLIHTSTVVFDSVTSDSSRGENDHSFVDADFGSENIGLTSLSDSGSPTDNHNQNTFVKTTDIDTDSSVEETSADSERTNEICKEQGMPLVEILPRKFELVQNHNLQITDEKTGTLSLISESSFFNQNPNLITCDEDLVLQSEQLQPSIGMLEHSTNDVESATFPVVTDAAEAVPVVVVDSKDNICNSDEFWHERACPDLSQSGELLKSSDGDKMEIVLENAGAPSESESNSIESGVHSHDLTESSTNNVCNDEVLSSTDLSDSPVDNRNIPFGDSGNAAEGNDEQDSWPGAFKSSLYRCNSINLAEDTPDSGEAEQDFRKTDEEVINKYQEGLPSPVESDTESVESSSGSGQEYSLDQNNSGQPLTSSPNVVEDTQDSGPHTATVPSSLGDFDEYSLQIASEIYLSRGLKSPRKFEIPPLETIHEHHEHQPMPDIQEDTNYTPSDSSSVEVRYDELFGSDSYEWDDFGDSLIGKDTSHQSPHHRSHMFRDYDVSDWSMDNDSTSFASSSNMPSLRSEKTTLSSSRQSDNFFASENDISFNSGSSRHFSSDSESVTLPYLRSLDSSKETLVSSILSQLQSPVMSPASGIKQNNFYSLTEKFDLETDSSSEGLASPTAGTSVVESLPSSNLTSPTSLSPSHVISVISEQHSGSVLPVPFDASPSSTSSSTESKKHISSEESNLISEPVHDLVDNTFDMVQVAPEVNTQSQNVERTEGLKPLLKILNPVVTVENGSGYADNSSVFLDNHQTSTDA